MEYTNSPLATYVKLSPNNSGERTHIIDRITPHCTAFNCSVESLGDLFAKYHGTNGCSSNYGIGDNGKIGMFVEEKNRSWCSSSRENDQRAITIECSSTSNHPDYEMNGSVYTSLVNLCVDICKRYNKKKLLWLEDMTKTLNYNPKDDEMVLSVHRWFSAVRSCPGEWLYNRLGELAETVTKKLNPPKAPIYRVQIGAFKNKKYAEQYADKAKKAGFKGAFVVEVKTE